MSCVATFATVLYAYLGLSNIYRLMNPLSGIDLSVFPPSQLINPYWDTQKDVYQMKVYLSQEEQFSLSFLQADEDNLSLKQSQGEEASKKSSSTVLLWNDPEVGASSSGVDISELSKSFVLTPKLASSGCSSMDNDKNQCIDNSSVKIDLEKALSWYEEDTSTSFGSTSILITIYESIQNTFHSILKKLGISKNDTVSEGSEKKKRKPEILEVDADGPLWAALMKNNTVHAHVLLIRKPKNKQLLSISEDIQARAQELRSLIQDNSVILGTVSLIKHDEPVPRKPTRILYRDLHYFLQRYLFSNTDLIAPWDLQSTQPKEYQDWQTALMDKENNVGYPYWKPEVAIRLVSEDAKYPMDMAPASGMQIVPIRSAKHRKQHPSGYAYLPPLHVDEMGLTSEKYIPLNRTVEAVPLRITLDTHGMGGVPLSPQRWRLLSHLTETLKSQKETGLFEESDIDDVKSLIADTNVTLLGITMLASMLHLLFEFLTFKSDVEFWKENTDLTGLSVRALFLDVLCQTIILAYLIEMDSSLLMTVPQAMGIAIAMWKCYRGAGLKCVRRQGGEDERQSWVNRMISFTGYKIEATRLMHKTSASENTKKDSKSDNSETKLDLAALSDEMDRVATTTLGSLLLPFVAFYAVYTLIMDEYSGWYSWLITTSSSAVYALGFALMTPQLFLNYKLKSVAHLPWRVLCYKFLNTFIDDLFAFIIRMPTMARISCFRDDIVFFVYLAQRYMYPVDTSRPSEGGGGSAPKEEDKKITKPK